MKPKIVKEFEYDGLGFPILLLNVRVKDFRGIEAADIDYNLLQKNVLLALCHKLGPLTGNEVRFIRQFFEMTLVEFAKKLGITHPTVIHWEKAKNTAAKITPTTELYIRLFVLDELNADNKLFRSTFKEFNFTSSKAKKLESLVKPHPKALRIDAKAFK